MEDGRHRPSRLVMRREGRMSAPEDLRRGGRPRPRFLRGGRCVFTRGRSVWGRTSRPPTPSAARQHPAGCSGGQPRLGKGSTAQDAIGKGMTFTRARHNPLSLVILNERRFCASEGPRRAARTGVPIMPAFGVMGWAMPRVLCEAILARSARFLIILRQSSPRRDP